MISRQYRATRQEKDTDTLEQLASLAHEQWCEWSKEIAKKESISEKRRERWKPLWVPYHDLSDTGKREK